MDGEAGWWTTSGNIGLPPLARAIGVGRQQVPIGTEKALPKKSGELDSALGWGGDVVGTGPHQNMSHKCNKWWKIWRE